MELRDQPHPQQCAR